MPNRCLDCSNYNFEIGACRHNLKDAVPIIDDRGFLIQLNNCSLYSSLALVEDAVFSELDPYEFNIIVD